MLLIENIEENDTLKQYHKENVVWHHGSYALGTSQCKDAEKSAWNTGMRTAGFGTFRSIIEKVYPDLVQKAVEEDFERYSGRDDILSVAAKRKIFKEIEREYARDYTTRGHCACNKGFCSGNR